MQRRLTRAVLAAATIAAVAAALLAGCGRGPSEGRRILLVGIDGAEWNVARPLIDEGRLPNLERLMREGVYCGLRSLEPKEKSPVIWATIATGKYPEKHGVGDYVDTETGRLLTSNMWRARAFWDILGERGRKVCVVGWLVSWPATPVNGVMITDYFRYGPRPGRDPVEHTTYPEGLAGEMASLRVLPDEITDEEIADCVRLEMALTGEEAQRLPLEHMFQEINAIDGLAKRVNDFKSLSAGDRTFLAAALHCVETRDPQVLAVYLRGVDTASHLFWGDAHPGEVGFRVSETDRRVFGGAIEHYYERADAMLGRILDAFGDDAAVIVCSDHGFEGPRPGRQPGGIRDHGPVGVLVMAGDGIRSDGEIGERRVEDIAPTILALAGFPVAADMDGAVIDEALDEETLRSRPRQPVATYETEEPPERGHAGKLKLEPVPASDG